MFARTLLLSARRCQGAPRHSILTNNSGSIFIRYENVSLRMCSTSVSTANDLFLKCDYNGASELYATLIKQHPNDPGYLANQAICICHQPGKTEEAQAMATKAASLSGQDPRILLKLAHVLRETGQAERSVNILNGDKNIPVSPKLSLQDDWEYNYEMGRSLYQNWSRFSPAIYHFDKSLEVNPKNVLAMYWKGAALHWSGKGDGFDWMTDENLNGSTHCEFFKGLRAYREKNFEAALQHLNNARFGLRYNDDADVWSWKGEVYLELNQLEEATKCFDQALSTNPKDALSMHGKGEVAYKQNKKEEGDKLLTKALEMDRLYHKSDYFRQKKPIIPIV